MFSCYKIWILSIYKQSLTPTQKVTIHHNICANINNPAHTMLHLQEKTFFPSHFYRQKERDCL